MQVEHNLRLQNEKNRNPAPVESLTFLGFNENESANICLKRRERPFDSVDDLIEGLNIGDEIYKLKLDDGLDDRVDFALSINGHP
ncbi:unnamed protein product [Rhizophagus irregularis]|nr:unnamed protein product [Rhizophagus irregularis]